METIIHIGQHKTGSTSLQNTLFQHRSELRKQKYFYTNKILTHEHNSHYILNVYALDRNRFSSMKEKLIKSNGEKHIEELNEQLPTEIKTIYDEALRQNCNKIIWSNEGLYLLNSKQEYERLFNLFKPFSTKITVTCCFRERESYRISYLKELQKKNISLSNIPGSCRYLKPDSWLFDYDRKKRILYEVFDQCLFWDYKKEDNIKPFLTLFNIEIEGNINKRLNVTTNNHEEPILPSNSISETIKRYITKSKNVLKRILH